MIIIPNTFQICFKFDKVYLLYLYFREEIKTKDKTNLSSTPDFFATSSHHFAVTSLWWSSGIVLSCWQGKLVHSLTQRSCPETFMLPLWCHFSFYLRFFFFFLMLVSLSFESQNSPDWVKEVLRMKKFLFLTPGN